MLNVHCRLSRGGITSKYRHNLNQYSRTIRNHFHLLHRKFSVDIASLILSFYEFYFSLRNNWKKPKSKYQQRPLPRRKNRSYLEPEESSTWVTFLTVSSNPKCRIISSSLGKWLASGSSDQKRWAKASSWEFLNAFYPRTWSHFQFHQLSTDWQEPGIRLHRIPAQRSRQNSRRVYEQLSYERKTPQRYKNSIESIYALLLGLFSNLAVCLFFFVFSNLYSTRETARRLFQRSSMEQAELSSYD